MNKQQLLKKIVLVAIMLIVGANLNAQKKAYVHFSNIVNGGMLMRFYYDDQISQHGGKVVIIPAHMSNNWNNHDMKTITRVIFDASFKECTSIKSTHGWFYGCSKLTQIDHLDYLNTDSVTDMGCMFYNCSKLTSIDVSHFNTENVTNMWEMFRECSSLTELDLSNFNTNKLNTFYWMFRGCRNLEKLNISSFNTENVISFEGLFTSCAKLKTLDVSHFNTENAQVMKDMFYGCSSLEEIDVSNFNTSKVYSMDGMFTAMSNLKKLDIRNFNTSAVKNMNSMFKGCTSLTRLDLSNFDTRKVTNIAQMFYNCTQLKSIYVGDDWSTDAVPDGYGNNVFLNCTELVGGKGTAYNEEHTDCSYAHVDGGTSNPGYFTYKEYVEPSNNIIVVKDEETGTTITAEVKEPEEEGQQPTATITEIELPEGETTVVIPETVNDIVVNEIGEGFAQDNKDITEVVIPETIETIGADAFSGCENLTGEIDLSNVTEIGDGAFHGCTGVDEFHFGQDAEDITIGERAFTMTTEEEKEEALDADIYIPAGQREEYREEFGKEEGDPLYPYFQEESEKIFEELKDEETGIEFVGSIDPEGQSSWTITDGTNYAGDLVPPEELYDEPVIGIGKGAFKGNLALTGVELNSNIKSIGSEAFNGCENIQNNVVVESAMDIGDLAFNDCNKVDDIIIKEIAENMQFGRYPFCRSLPTMARQTTTLETGTVPEPLNARIFVPEGELENYRTKFAQTDQDPLWPNFQIGKVFEGDPTGIYAIEYSDNQKAANAVYDLQGRKISNLSSRPMNLPKGIYIINGKKVVR